MKLSSLKVLRESGKRKLFIIPYLFTFASSFLGFLAVIQVFDYKFLAAAYLIMGAVLMDFLDGRIARALHSASSLGMELDSLSDAISFCFAPAILLYCWYLYHMGLVGLLVLAVYLSAGLMRLAKFNVISLQEGTKDFFVGLPTTSAAFLLVLLVARAEWVITSPLRFLLHPVGILIVILTLAFLMISPIRFPSFKRVQIPPKIFLPLAALAVLIGAILLFKGVPVFLFGLLGYICASIVLGLYSFARTVLTR